MSEVLDTIRRLADEGMAMMVATHEMGFAREVGSRLIFMDEGRIVEDGKPQDIFANPTDERTKSFPSHVLQIVGVTLANSWRASPAHPQP